MKTPQTRREGLRGIREADVEFGPGLNVLYGPNDLGKSTLADAIRLALLLPHTSTHIEQFVPWTGGQNPVVELTFETEAAADLAREEGVRQRRRVAAGGVEERRGLRRCRARAKSGRQAPGDSALGYSEPGGSGRQQGPSDELSRDCAAVDAGGRQRRLLGQLAGRSDRHREGADCGGAAGRGAGSAVRRVAEATQARRDEAYTDKGAKKTAKGSVFKSRGRPAEGGEGREGALQRIVEDSEGVEKQLRELTARAGSA